ncbi:ubiquitin carboxyl-terminal hydrolase [Anaeramoeba flamelloides]|uniref:Ubiquitin carboxyl-terminal hydrolase n=1 Tax=Anaeramoeba flamelloides TaxID=1746091 RepID=A0AAV8A008_9EUKA|nr:ubiquitin carboxyl-terminal hydrolase [Anaeramoeba flamelloides]
MTEPSWPPLESNPNILTTFARELGLPKEYQITDVFSLDLLMMIPHPCHAVILLYPITEKNKELKKIQQETSREFVFPKNLYYMKQTIRNACGTIGVLHAVLNNIEELGVKGWFKKFHEQTIEMDPETRGHTLEKDKEMIEKHEEHSEKGQTDQMDPEESTDYHFVTFVCKNNILIQCDGRKETPIFCGETSPETLLEDASLYIKEQYLKRDPENLMFSFMALTHVPEED